MKVLMVNGSPRADGSTNRALVEIAKTLAKEGVESEIFWLSSEPIGGCKACRFCAKNSRCVYDDKVNEFRPLAKNADGFIFGSPVYYAGANGAISSFLDRLFYSDAFGDHNDFYLKPGAAIVAARRAGSTAAIDQLNKYFTISQMPVISSRYWNIVFGANAQDVEKDLEGLQTMRVLAQNMAYFLRCKDAAIKAGVPLPKREESVWTNFIR
ncbi:MAG: flavodoxin family protein [Helicobacteraceae bacterium]|jgi:multimeric flavodoxin WrbA|nr:flavodoxin family protein [Helicobacteraceae bacterium]